MLNRTNMPRDETIMLRNHHLYYIPELSVDSKLLEARFTGSCSMSNCRGDCCRYGVWVDLKERDLILSHSAMIIRHMEPHQEKNPEQWFEQRDIADPDFPSGRAIGTQERPTGCVFLDSNGRCVLQKAASAEGLYKFYLKPFFCVAYPITIEGHTLTLDDEEFPENFHCCSARPGGSKTVLDICEEELQFTLGSEGLEEIRKRLSPQQK